MHYDSPLSNDTNESSETCILCLDGVDDNTVWFPCKYSTCTCKYALHLKCIKENNIIECIICKSKITYPISVQLLDKSIFEKTVSHSIRDLTIHINTQNVELRDIEDLTIETTPRNCKCIKKIGIYFLGTIMFVGFGLSVWYLSN